MYNFDTEIEYTKTCSKIYSLSALTRLVGDKKGNLLAKKCSTNPKRFSLGDPAN